jgi:RNA polymerase sigma-70 factor (ECF subfamily)
MNIKECIAKSAKGDGDAYKELYDHLVDRLFRYAITRVRTRDDAKDVVQQVLVDLWLNMEKFEYSSDEQFYQYVYVKLKRRLGKYYRSMKHDISLEESGIDSMYEIDVYTKSDIEVVKKVMATLKDEYQEILELRHFSECSFKEIAQILNMSSVAVRVTHHRALKALKAKMPTL